MRRGIQQELLRRLGRALRHGIVVSGVCLLIALITGISGYAFGGRPEAAHGEALPPTREAASTSTEVIGRWLKPITENSALAVETTNAEPELDAESVPAPEVVTVQIQSLQLAASDPGIPRSERRAGAGAVPLRPGDRSLVSVSFYYCESTGSSAGGDGGGFCGLARDGTRVRSGTAACDVAYLGQRFRIDGDPTGRTYVCADTGSAVHGMHRDIWFLDNRDGWGWQQAVGTNAVIEVQP